LCDVAMSVLVSSPGGAAARRAARVAFLRAGLRGPADRLPVRGSASLRLVEITRALPALVRLREDARPFDDDAMPGSSPAKLTWQLSRLPKAARVQQASVLSTR